MKSAERRNDVRRFLKKDKKKCSVGSRGGEWCLRSVHSGER